MLELCLPGSEERCQDVNDSYYNCDNDHSHFICAVEATANIRYFLQNSAPFFHQRISEKHEIDWLTFKKNLKDIFNQLKTPLFKCYFLTFWSVLLLQFPHLVFGAVASSAPVRATLDFSTYTNVMLLWSVKTSVLMHHQTLIWGLHLISY